MQNLKTDKKWQKDTFCIINKIYLVNFFQRFLYQLAVSSLLLLKHLYFIVIALFTVEVSAVNLMSYFVPIEIGINRINNTQIDEAHDFDIVMTMYNLIEYGDNFSKIYVIVW